MKYPAILLTGPTGCGKSPLGDLLEEQGLWGRRCLHFDFGENLRQSARGGPSNPLNETETDFIRKVLTEGAVLEDKDFPVAEKIFRAFGEQRSAGPDDLIVLNGLPRHTGQAEKMNELVEVRMLISLECSSETVVSRISTDSGGDREGRTDDGLELVEKKLEIYRRRTRSLIEFYRSRNCRIETIQVEQDTGPAEIIKKISDVPA